MSEIRMVFQHFGSAQFAHLVYLSFPFVVSVSSSIIECYIFPSFHMFRTSHSACQKTFQNVDYFPGKTGELLARTSFLRKRDMFCRSAMK